MCGSQTMLLYTQSDTVNLKANVIQLRHDLGLP